MKPLDPRLVRATAATRRFLGASVAIGVVRAALAVGQAVLLATGVARVVERRGTEGLGPLLVALAAVVAGRAALAWVHESVAQRSAAAVKSTLRARLVRRAADDAALVGGHSARAAVVTAAGPGLDALDPYFSRYLPQLALAVIVPPVVLVALAATDLTAAVTVALTLPLIPIFMVLVGRLTENANARRWDALTRLSHHFLDVVEGMPTLRAFGRGDAQAALVRESTDRYRGTTMVTLRVAFLSALVLELLATLSVALVAVGVGLRMVDGELGLRTGLMAILLAPEAFTPVRQVGAHYHASAAGVAAVDAVFAVLDAPARTPYAAGDRPVPDGPLRLTARDVTVRHGAIDAPNACTLTASSGSVLCLTGRSGAGKTTLLAVLLGLRTPDHGDVVVESDDGAVPLSSIARDEWLAAIAWVDQRPAVVPGTVAENLRIADPAADDERLRGALAAVGLDLPLDRLLGGPDQLSAGERRRLAAARALVRRGRLVLLDEPTAGLDRDAEQQVLTAIRGEAARGAAVVMIAHRPAAIAAADQVVELP